MKINKSFFVHFNVFIIRKSLIVHLKSAWTLKPGTLNLLAYLFILTLQYLLLSSLLFLRLFFSFYIFYKNDLSFTFILFYFENLLQRIFFFNIRKLSSFKMIPPPVATTIFFLCCHKIRCSSSLFVWEVLIYIILSQVGLSHKKLKVYRTS